MLRLESILPFSPRKLSFSITTIIVQYYVLLSAKPRRDATLGLGRGIFNFAVGLIDFSHSFLACIFSVLVKFALSLSKLGFSLVYL